MARKTADLTACGFVQQLNVDYWDWSDDELKAVENEDLSEMCSIIRGRLENIGLVIAEMYAIIHDKDSQEQWSEIYKRYEIVTKAKHVHILVKFEEPKAKLEDIAAAVGLSPEFVEKPKRGKYAYNNMLAYLIHAKYADKYQYDYTEVLTVAGMPYSEVYHNNLELWERGRAKVAVDKSRESIDWLEAKILSGEVTRSQVFLTDRFFTIYSQYKRRCDDAFQMYGERKAYKTIQAMENGEFKLTVFFITGKARSGKSAFTDRLVQQLKKDAYEEFGEVWTSSDAASSNPFDDYNGEEILVMDDLRGMALTASDWLKLLDPDRVSMNSARYRNKRVAARAILINSEREPFEFFYYIKGNGAGGARAEAMDQFFDRIMSCVRVCRIGEELDSARAIQIADSVRTNEPYHMALPIQSGGDLELNYKFEQKHSEPYLDPDTAAKMLSRRIIERNKLTPKKADPDKIQRDRDAVTEYNIRLIDEQVEKDIEEHLAQEEEYQRRMEEEAEEYFARKEEEDTKRKDKEDERDTWANPSGGISWGDDDE